MIDPRYQWAIQIEVTNKCNRDCANCTRLVGHAPAFVMTPTEFREACEALRDFPTDSPPATHVPRKVVGMLGGEPLLHPFFKSLCETMKRVIPHRKHRGLWTGLTWQNSSHYELIEETFGYINNNRHNSECRHSPVLVAMSDVVKDNRERQRLISECWLQRRWSSSITPKGFFFCEVAAAMDWTLGGPGGLPVEPGCWKRRLKDFEYQIKEWCPRCGIPLNLKGRLDTDEVDDISPSNLADLSNSPRVQAGKYVLYEPEQHNEDDRPWKYLK